MFSSAGHIGKRSYYFDCNLRRGGACNCYEIASSDPGHTHAANRASTEKDYGRKLPSDEEILANYERRFGSKG